MRTSILCDTHGGRLNRAFAAFAVAVTLCVTEAPASADTVSVVLDQAKVIKLPDRVSTVVVGNPLIADVSVQAGGLLVVTGKGYGITNLVALDRTGSVLMDKNIQVQGPRQDVLVVYRGIDRETYSCAPNCERRITLGDMPGFFEATLAQTGSRNSQAQTGTVPQPGPAPR